MNKNSTAFLAIFALLGMFCGAALVLLLQPQGTASASNTYSVSAVNAAHLAPQPAADPAAQASGPGPRLTSPGDPGQAQPNSPAAPDATVLNNAFNYQGMLRQGGQPVNATCDMQVSLWDSESGVVQLGVTETLSVPVANGLFSVLVNDHAEFNPGLNGLPVWLETSVRCPSGSGTYTTLAPRQFTGAAPLASNLAPYTVIKGAPTDLSFPALTIQSPVFFPYTLPVGLYLVSGPQPFWGIGIAGPTGILVGTKTGQSIWAVSENGVAIRAKASGIGGQAANFDGDVTVTGKLTVPRFHAQQLINITGPLPVTGAPFTTYGGTLLLTYSGTGYNNTSHAANIGMTVRLDGNVVDMTGIYSNLILNHLAFLPKQWVLTNIPAGSHTITLEAMNADTGSDAQDIYEVMLLELPY